MNIESFKGFEDFKGFEGFEGFISSILPYALAHYIPPFLTPVLRTGYPIHFLYLDASACALAPSISSMSMPVLMLWPLPYLFFLDLEVFEGFEGFERL